MIIGIDASRYGMAHKTGVERYSDHIIDELCHLANQEKKTNLQLYCREQNNRPKINGDYCENIIIKGKRLWTQYYLSKYLKKNKPDLLFVPSHVLPLNLGKKNVIMIHDLAFVNFAEAYSPMQRFFLKVTTRRACKKADKIIVPSEATKKDLIKLYKCPEDKIKIIYHGFDDLNLPKYDHKEKEPLILYVGRIETKKNLIRLVKAFANFKKKNPEWKMILAGPFGHGSDKIIEAIKENCLENEIKTPEYISEDEKHELLQKASIFAFVSLAEGFGFPILEAFHFKTPVLTSAGCATEEVGGNAACYINPLDTTSIQEGLEKLASNKAIRDELINNMPTRLKKFSWKKSGEKTWKLLRSLL